MFCLKEFGCFPYTQETTTERFMVPVQLASNLVLKPSQLEKVGRSSGGGVIFQGSALRGH